MIPSSNQKQGQRKDQNHNKSGDGGQALQTDRQKSSLQSIVAPPSFPDSGPAGKLIDIKARIAELLDLVEALQPGFAKDTALKLEPDMAAAPVAKSKAVDSQAVLTSLEELADLLEELVELMRDSRSHDAGEGPSEGAMEAVAFGYETAAGQLQAEKEPLSVEMFMSINDQLSPEARMEVVQILSTMAFGSDDHEQVPVGPHQSFIREKPKPAETGNEFGTMTTDYRDNPTFQTLQSYHKKAFELVGENDAVSFEFLVDVVELIAGGKKLTDRFDLTAIAFDMPRARAAVEMEAFLAALERAVALLGNGQDRDALDRIASALDQSSLATGVIATEFLVAGLGAKAYERFFRLNKEGLLKAVTPFDQDAVFEFARELESRTDDLMGKLRDLNILSETRNSISKVFRETDARLEMLWEAENTTATALYDIESAFPGFLDNLTQLISDNHTQASDSIPDGFDPGRLDRANGIDKIKMRVALGQLHFNKMWGAFLDLSSMAGQMETILVQEGADRALETFISQFGQLDAQFQQEVENIILGIRTGTIVPPGRGKN
jgi:hypothetical protein